jgi:hypothetical protein
MPSRSTPKTPSLGLGVTVAADAEVDGAAEADALVEADTEATGATGCTSASAGPHAGVAAPTERPRTIKEETAFARFMGLAT